MYGRISRFCTGVFAEDLSFLLAADQGLEKLCLACFFFWTYYIAFILTALYEVVVHPIVPGNLQLPDASQLELGIS